MKGTLFGQTLWPRGYCASTVGLDEAMIREYVQNNMKTRMAKNKVCSG